MIFPVTFQILFIVKTNSVKFITNDPILKTNSAKLKVFGPANKKDFSVKISAV